MSGRPYLDTMHADHENLIMRYLLIRWSDLEIENTVTSKSQDHFYDMQ